MTTPVLDPPALPDPTTTQERQLDPGAYEDVPEALYHRDPVAGGSLSASGARRLLPPSTPAHFQHWRTAGEQTSAEFDLGHAAHRLVLGTGLVIRRVEYDSWRTNAAKAEAAAARKAGEVPLLADDHDKVLAMAAALRADPVASKLFVAGGRAEVTIVWIDPTTRVVRRGRIDWLIGRYVVDYKTTREASDDAIERAIANYGYHAQLAGYCDGVKLLGLAGDPVPILVAQEKEPPYLVNVKQLDELSMRIGRERNARALEIYRDCTAAGIWPGYSDRVTFASVPRWHIKAHEEESRTW